MRRARIRWTDRGCRQLIACAIAIAVSRLPTPAGPAMSTAGGIESRAIDPGEQRQQAANDPTIVRNGTTALSQRPKRRPQNPRFRGVGRASAMLAGPRPWPGYRRGARRHPARPRRDGRPAEARTSLRHLTRPRRRAGFHRLTWRWCQTAASAAGNNRSAPCLARNTRYRPSTCRSAGRWRHRRSASRQASVAQQAAQPGDHYGELLLPAWRTDPGRPPA